MQQPSAARRYSPITVSLLLIVGCCVLQLHAPLQSAPAEPPETTVTLTAVGDILLDRGVAKKIEKGNVTLETFVIPRNVKEISFEEFAKHFAEPNVPVAAQD